MNAWFVVASCGAVCLALRLSFVLLVDRLTTPPWFQPLTARVMPAAFAALAASALVGHLDGGGADAAPVAVAVVVTIAVTRRHGPRSGLAAGIATVWLISAATTI